MCTCSFAHCSHPGKSLYGKTKSLLWCSWICQPPDIPTQSHWPFEWSTNTSWDPTPRPPSLGERGEDDRLAQTNLPGEQRVVGKVGRRYGEVSCPEPPFLTSGKNYQEARNNLGNWSGWRTFQVFIGETRAMESFCFLCNTQTIWCIKDLLQSKMVQWGLLFWYNFKHYAHN